MYVCLGANERERNISFAKPDDVPQAELLEKGFAIDGDNAGLTVTAYVDGDGNRVPLLKALNEVQVDLVKWLSRKDYEVIFV